MNLIKSNLTHLESYLQIIGCFKKKYRDKFQLRFFFLISRYTWLAVDIEKYCLHFSS